MDVFLARQPIFNRDVELFGYELLFRANDTSAAFDGTDAEAATTQVIANTVLSIGLDNVISGKKAFVNFNEALLRSGLHAMLPRDRVVLEILESVQMSSELAELCRTLRDEGYTIALDDFTPAPELEPLTEFAQVIKIDMHAVPQADQRRMLATYQGRGIAMIAEKVETAEDFQWARDAGYDNFQGFFFARPSLVRGRQIPSAKFNCLRLLQEMQNPELDFNRLQAVISQDLSFSFKLLRYVNSALFSHAVPIDSIAQALMMLGENGVRHWVALAALPELAKNKPGELVTHSLLRASFCERLAKLAGLESSQGFIMGLFSLLDALIDMPLDEALRQAGVGPMITAALLETGAQSGLLRQIYSLARSYEQCDWPAVTASAAALKIEAPGISQAYSDATFWAQRALHATTRQGNSRREARMAKKGSLRILWEDERGQERISNAKLRNVSSSGLQLQLSHKIPPRTLIRCNEPQLGVSGSGSVRYCNPDKGEFTVGVEFTNSVKTPKR